MISKYGFHVYLDKERVWRVGGGMGELWSISCPLAFVISSTMHFRTPRLKILTIKPELSGVLLKLKVNDFS